MKFNLSFLASLIVILLALSSCSKTENSNDEKLLNTVSQELVSPNGVLMAKSLTSLHEIISPSVEGLFTEEVEFNITNYDFLETDNQTAMIINFETKDRITNQVIFIKEYSILRAPDKCYTIVCDGDCECQPNGTIRNDGVNFACSGDGCSCSMTIREHDCDRN